MKRSRYLNPRIFVRGARLLDMDYTVKELAEELDLNPRYIREYLIAEKGAPVQPRESPKDHLYINGKELYDWAVAYHKQQCAQKVPLKENEFYCCRCHGHVVPDSYTLGMSKSGVAIKKAVCPVCGAPINKYEKAHKA